jgi:hypothetical protein
MSLNNRVGIFRVAAPSDDWAAWHDSAMAVLEQCLVVRCEKLHHMNCFEYVAISRHFDEVAEGERLREYVPVVEVGADGHPVLICFKPIND